MSQPFPYAAGTYEEARLGSPFQNRCSQIRGRRYNPRTQSQFRNLGIRQTSGQLAQHAERPHLEEDFVQARPIEDFRQEKSAQWSLARQGRNAKPHPKQFCEEAKPPPSGAGSKSLLSRGAFL